MIKKGLAFLGLISASCSFTVFAQDLPETINESGNKIVLVKTSQDSVVYYILERDRSKNVNEIPVPHFAIHTLNNKFVMTIGAQINPIIGADMGNNLYKQEGAGINFVPSQIPVPATNGHKSDFYLDCLNAVVDFQIVGFGGTKNQITGYLKIQTNGNDKSIYLDKAYVAWRGLSTGLKSSLFSDESIIPPNIDPQGPCGLNKTTVSEIGYTSPLYKGFGFGIGLDMPAYSPSNGYYWGTSKSWEGQQVCDPNGYSMAAPDVPIYIEWQKSAKNRLRLSGIVRPMIYKNIIDGKRETSVGWGLSLSGNIQPVNPLTFSLQATYGKGISEYIQDLAGIPLSFTPNDKRIGIYDASPMMGWMAAITYNINPKLQLNAMASQARIWDVKDYGIRAEGTDNFRYSTYVATNVFYNISSYFQLGLEYLYGYRNTWGTGNGHDNRLQMQIMFLL